MKTARGAFAEIYRTADYHGADKPSLPDPVSTGVGKQII